MERENINTTIYLKDDQNLNKIDKTLSINSMKYWSWKTEASSFIVMLFSAAAKMEKNIIWKIWEN